MTTVRRRPFPIGGKPYWPVEDLRWSYFRPDGTHAFDKVRLVPLDRHGKPPPREVHRGKEYAYDVPDADDPELMLPSKGNLPPDAHDLLYRLPELIAGLAAGATVYWTEGERDADTLAALGFVATCHHGGAGMSTPDQAEWLRGAARVVLLMDRDGAGWCCVMQRYDLLAGDFLPLVDPSRIRVCRVRGHDEDAHGLVSHTMNDVRDWLGAPDLTPVERRRRARRLKSVDPAWLRTLLPATAGERQAIFEGEGYGGGNLSGWRASVGAFNGR